MLDDVKKKQMLTSYIDNIACMSDINYQERVWVLSKGPECDDIDDTICDFFDDDYILEKYTEFGISDSQYELLKNLHNKLSKFSVAYRVYNHEIPTEELIKLDEWREIISISKDILKAFHVK